jgi:ComF family protein
MSGIKQYLSDFLSLFFPEICYACGDSLVESEALICSTCLYQLPFTNYHLEPENKLAKQFWGRVHINSAMAFLYFNKGGKVQNLMHQLKYNNQQQIGVILGNLYGKQLLKDNTFKNIDAIIPVPLHPKKQKKRGYNQSEKFAIGLSEILNIKICNDILYRAEFKESQTSKSRSNRFDNMKTVFRAHETLNTFENIILVDDTITTGATLEACVLALQQIGIKNINIVGIAFTA